MNSHYTLLTDLIEKAVKISQECVIQVNCRDFEALDSLIKKREKIISVICTVHERLTLEQTSLKNIGQKEDAVLYNNQLNLLMNKISEFDDFIVASLDEEKNKTQIEIAKTFKNKENLKGYNLNCLK
jgi:RNA processing factor Prp31